ncbi:MAG TPA: helix-turn-helix domain-containing protein [Dongiaceae bacterium]|nr:helix-turn-helix domain-containing protein [Dongiaceae bacterium]
MRQTAKRISGKTPATKPAAARPAGTSAKPRRRDAAATRAAILASARKAFARAGYDGVGVREIAAGAGVTAMLVNRYFGSKERLYAEVVVGTMASPDILTADIVSAEGDRTAFAHMVAAALVAKTPAEKALLDGFSILLRSTASEQAMAIWRKQIERHHQQDLSALLAGDHAATRAALLLAVMAGFQVMRQVVRLPALAAAEPAVLSAQLAALFRLLIAPRSR